MSSEVAGEAEGVTLNSLSMNVNGPGSLLIVLMVTAFLRTLSFDIT